MADQPDLFGQQPAQGNLFGAGEDRLQAPRQSTLPDPEKVRRRLRALLEQARAAERMPWSERDARMWQTVFPNMATGCRRKKPINCASNSLRNWSA